MSGQFLESLVLEGTLVATGTAEAASLQIQTAPIKAEVWEHLVRELNGKRARLTIQVVEAT
jgi:hypothetical protein